MAETGTSPAPKIIGGFEIISKLGSGGMGSVFKARQVSMDRLVALKVLPPKFAEKDPRFVERFVREARASAKLNHPHIVQGIEVGRDERSGLHYFAMEFVDGSSVGQLLKAGPMDEKRALEITRQVALALDCAHKAGIVHRDIKPDNILVTQQGVTKLADLGLAKKMASDASLTQSLPAMGPGANANLTQAGQTVGTPDYMSPEQAEGKADIDVRTDLYSLGGTLYHMLVGRGPFSGGTGMEVVMRHLTAPIPDAARENPKISRQSADLVTKLLQKDPAKRCQTPLDLIAEIDEVMAAHAGKTLRYATTSVQRPVTTGGLKRIGAGTTGPRRPVEDRANRGVGRAARAEGNSSQAVTIGAIAGGAVLLLALFFMFSGGGGSNKTAETKSRTKSAPAQQPAPAAAKTPALPAVVKTEPAAPEPAPAAQPAAPDPALLLARARTGWTAAVQKLDAAAAHAQLEAFAAEQGLSEAAQEPLQAALIADLRSAFDAFRTEFTAQIERGALAEARAKLNAFPVPPADSAWPPNVAFTALRQQFEAQLTAAEAAAKTTPAAPVAAAATGPALDTLFAQAEPQFVNNAPARAKQIFESAAKKPEWAAQAEALQAQAEATAWLDDVKAALEQGAAKLADGKPLELASTKRQKLKFGPGAEYVFDSVANGKLHAKHKAGMVVGVNLEDLDPPSQDKIFALNVLPTPEENAALAVKRTYADLVRMRALPELDGPSLFQIQERLALYKEAGAPPAVHAVAQAWADWRARQAPPPQMALDLGGGVTLELVLIQPGRFPMGTAASPAPPGHPLTARVAKDEQPARTVLISRPFYLGKFEVTQAQYRQVMGSNPSFFVNDQAPADSVSGQEAEAFCAKCSELTKLLVTLPTEAQWEYAAKAGGAGWMIPIGDPAFGGDAGAWQATNERALDARAWFKANLSWGTHPVGQKAPNAWGLYDTFGNVLEWCSDRYAPYDAQATIDPQGPAAGDLMTARGGTAVSTFDRCRPETRNAVPKALKKTGFGLRLCVPVGNSGAPIKK